MAKLLNKAAFVCRVPETNAWKSPIALSIAFVFRRLPLGAAGAKAVTNPDKDSMIGRQ